MNEEDKKLIYNYLSYTKKRNFLILIFIVIVVIIICLYNYSNSKISFNKVENTNLKDENNISKNEEELVKNETNIINEAKIIENKVVENKVIEQVSEEINKKDEVQDKKESSEIKEKPVNKDFLFSDGYTMENVTEVALDYLKSQNYSGECIPIQDEDGVYLGMRVVFY